MERLEAVLNDRLQLGEAFLDRVNHSRAELERQIVERDQEYQRRIHDSTSKLKSGLEQLQHSADDLQVALLERDIHQLEAEAAAVEAKFEAVDTQCQLFENLLKIKVLRVEDTQLQFVMTHINRSDPEQVYIFTLQPEDNSTYTVFDQDPDLPNFRELVAELNKTNDIGNFVRMVRKGWEEL